MSAVPLTNLGKVISRRVGERVRVSTPAGDVLITLSSVDGSVTARMGIKAPRHFTISEEDDRGRRGEDKRAS